MDRRPRHSWSDCLGRNSTDLLCASAWRIEVVIRGRGHRLRKNYVSKIRHTCSMSELIIDFVNRFQIVYIRIILSLTLEGQSTVMFGKGLHCSTRTLRCTWHGTDFRLTDSPRLGTTDFDVTNQDVKYILYQMSRP